MKEVFYKKVGRRYVPVSEYDSVMLDGFPKGTHLVMCYPGGESRRYNIDPNHAALIAAGRIAEDAIVKALVKATEMRPQKTKLTVSQKNAWDNLAKELGDDLATLTTSSAYEVASAGVNAMIEEANRLMDVPSVKKAYEHFVLIAELTKDNKHESNC